MTDEQLAMKMYEQLCSFLDKSNVEYNKNTDRMAVFFDYCFDNTSIKLIMHVNAQNHYFELIMPLSFVVHEELSMEMAMGLALVNSEIFDGHFDYDDNKGNVFFRMTNCYPGSLISEDVFDYMIHSAHEAFMQYGQALSTLGTGSGDIGDVIK
ncbi:MAG: hypothetical protein ACI4M5_06905 [Christensenellales bacterium]